MTLRLSESPHRGAGEGVSTDTGSPLLQLPHGRKGLSLILSTRSRRRWQQGARLHEAALGRSTREEASMFVVRRKYCILIKSTDLL
jgi:hypothetical protein